MLRHAKIKTAAARMSVRKTVTSATAATRRSFPAWIDSGETSASFAANRSATPRVRAGLVLRTVTRKSVERRMPHGSRSR